MQKGSIEVINLDSCKSAALKFHPFDPDELFNRTWLLLREVEIKRPEWKPDNIEAYFIRMLKNESIALKKESARLVEYSENKQEVEQINDERIERELILLDWLESESESDEVMFCKNIITLAVYSPNINYACEAAEMNRDSFWKYRKRAIKQFYADTNYSPDHNLL